MKNATPSKKVPAFTPYFTEDEASQVRAAFLAAGAPEGYASVSDLIVAATMREVKRLQRRHNQGRKWVPAPAGALRRGQRTREEIQHRHEGL
jgi:Centromere-binding protein ParB C-terminal